MGTRIDLDLLLGHTEWVRALALDVLRDRDRADDVVQETWIAALRHLDADERDGPRLRAWLSRVARNLARMSARGESRRARREAQEARRDETPSTADTLERIALQREVAAAVMSLEPVDRDVVSLRYYDGLPPREIARRLGLTPNAVSLRLTRAKASLRARLEADDERGAHWAVVAAGWTVRRGAADWVGPVALGGGLSVKTITMASAALLAALMLGLYVLRALPLGPRAAEPLALLDEEPLRVQGTTDGATALEARNEQDARIPIVVTLPDAASLARTSVAQTGGVHVRVVRADDGAPVAGVGLELHAWDQPDDWFHARRTLTDEQGRTRFDTVAPGAATIHVQRVTAVNTFGAQVVDVVAGEVHEVEFALVAGSSVRGRVVDFAERPVAGAEIWLGEGTGAPHFGQVVARSAEDGSFELHHLLALQALAARAPGYAPSKARMPIFHLVDGEPAIELELVLPDLGGALEGRVVDAHGAPVADAIVLVGNAVADDAQPLDDKPAWDAPLVRLRSDADGSFRVEGVASEPTRVRARGLGTAVAECMVDVRMGDVARVQLTLEPAAKLVGVVRHASGRAVVGARVELASDADALHRSVAPVRADGSFALDGVPVGTLNAIVSVEEERLTVRAELETRAGETCTWNPTFPSIDVLTGRLVDERGQSLAGWVLRRQTHDPGIANEMAQAMTNTDADGRFRFDACPLAAHTLNAYPPGQWFLDPAVTTEGAEPGGDELLLRVPLARIPTCSLRGRVIDEAGDGIAGAELALHGDALYLAFQSDAQGNYTVSHLPPIAFRLSVTAAGHAEASIESSEPLRTDEERTLAPIVLTRDDG